MLVPCPRNNCEAEKLEPCCSTGERFADTLEWFHKGRWTAGIKKAA
jgi:hypothetical protein